MRNRIGFAFIGIAGVLFAACSQLQRLTGRQATAAVALAGPAGEIRGGGDVWQDNDGKVHVELQLQGLPPGTHAIHFHSVGNCAATPDPTFSAAGGHFNPFNKQHGLNNPAGPHAGDAPNFEVSADGTAKVNFVTDRVTLTAGPIDIFDDDGTSLVVHASADDQMSQPAGNAGTRIACGVIKKVL